MIHHVPDMAVANRERHRADVPRAGEQAEVGLEHCDAVQGGGNNDGDADIGEGLDRAVHE